MKFSVFIFKAVRKLIDFSSYFLSDESFLKLKFLWCQGYKLNIEEPKTFNEKLQWLKLYDHKDEYTKMVDKVAAKDYVASIIGSKYVIPTLGVWNTPEEIEWEKLPNRFVIKNTNDSGGVVICKDKSCLNKDSVVKILKKGYGKDFSRYTKEYPYKNVPHRIIAEAYMEDGGTEELKDYKFFCFDGEVKFFKIDFDRFIYHRANYYSPDGKFLPFGESDYPYDETKILTMPANLNEMKSIAEKLSKGIPFLRVDLYSVSNNIFFGELTFYPASGMGRFTSRKWDEEIGGWLKLPEITKG